MSLIFQAFYGISGLRNDKGMPTGAVFGFAKQMRRLPALYPPTHMVVVFDSPGKTFRHEIYPEYKANREEAPEGFHVQLPYVFQLVDAMRLAWCAKVGYEADDLLGVLARQASKTLRAPSRLTW